jgi:hypothetical protein
MSARGGTRGRRRVGNLPIQVILEVTSGPARLPRGRLDLPARDGRKLESPPDQIMDEVLAKVATIFG